MWRPEENIVTERTVLNNKITIVKGKYCPFLDIKMYWSKNNKIRVKICMKENQKIKYINKGSCHTSTCFQAIPNGVFKRLYKLTLPSNKIFNSGVDEIYPEHAEAMNIANLVLKKTIPQNEINQNNDLKNLTNLEKEEIVTKEEKIQTNILLYWCL